jgi:hypothetical protein
LETTWERIEGWLDEDIEQNIEYWHGDRTYYVRAPWQLYFLALVARHDFRGKFSRSAVQRALGRIVAQVNNGGFKYPHSGKMLSSRTNGILFEVLTIIASEWRLQNLSILPRVGDVVLRSRVSRIAVYVFALAFLAWSIFSWYRSPMHSIGEIAPNAMFGLLTLLVAFGRGR